MPTSTKFFLFMLLDLTTFQAQTSQIERLIDSELKMTFPSIYFKHHSTDYAAMPYPVDSCLKHIAANIKNINSYAIWRDSSETEALSGQRIKKLKTDLKKYRLKSEIKILSMDTLQKVSRLTLNMSNNKAQRDYLLSLNSVLDISKVRFTPAAFPNKSHILRPRIWCGDCWKNGFHLNKSGREIRKMARRAKHKKKPTEKQHKQRKRIHRLVWTGWKTGFHWSTPGKPNKK